MTSKTPALKQTLNRASRRKLSKKNSAKVTGAKQSVVNSRNVSLGLLATAGLMTVGMTCAAAGTSTVTTANAFRNAINSAASGDTIQLDAGGTADRTFTFLNTGEGSGVATITSLNNVTIEGVNFGGVDGDAPVIALGGGQTLNTPFLSIVTSSNIVIQDIGFGNFGAGVFSFDDSDVTLNNVYFYNNYSNSSGAAISAVNTSNVTINNSSFNANDSFGNGGAISVDGSILTVNNSTFINNYSHEDGGAIYSYDSTVTINDSAFVVNNSDGDGGAIAAVSSTVTITNESFFFLNYSLQDGGAISAFSSTVNITDSNFEDNNAYEHGGAIYAKGSDLTIVGGAFDSNEAGYNNYIGYNGYDYNSHSGGAIYMGALVVEGATIPGPEVDTFITDYFAVSGELTITGTNFIYNQSPNDGGAIALRGINAALSNTYFAGNHAGNNGGAIDFDNFNYEDLVTRDAGGSVSGSTYAAFYSTLTISDSTFLSNSASDEGGAIYIDDSVVTISDSTFGRIPLYVEDDLGGGSFLYYGNYAGDEGGAIYIDDSVVTISNSTFVDNESVSEEGGAIYIEGSVVTISDSTFENNSADEEGGAIFVRGQTYSVDLTSPYVYVSSIVTISDSTFEDNYAGDEGGAIYIRGSIVTISDSTFENNSADEEGGAIYVRGVSFDTNPSDDNYNFYPDGFVLSSLTISGSTFVGNNSDEDEGGAIYIEASIVNISDSTFEDNSADEEGGAIYVRGADYEDGFDSNAYVSSIVTISDSTFEDSYADKGGAIYIQGSVVTISDSTFENNSADEEGGAIYVRGGSYYDDQIDSIVYVSSSLTISGSTFEGNFVTADNGGAIYIQGSVVTISDSTFEGNFVDRYAYEDYDGNIYVYGGDGGAIYVRGGTYFANDNVGAVSVSSSLTISGSTFEDNTAYGDGGAISATDSYVAVYDSLFVGNYGYNGGAISFSDGTLTVYYSVFNSNEAAYEGGAIDGTVNYSLGEDSIALAVVASIFNGNVSGSLGGAITFDAGYGTDNFDVRIWSSIFEGNIADDGAAVFVENAGYVDINGSIFNANVAMGVGEDQTGSAVSLYNINDVALGYSQFYDGGALTLADVAYSNVFASTFTENSGAAGGAVQIGNNFVEDGGFHTFSYNTFVDNHGFEDGLFANSIYATSGELNLIANVFADSSHSNNQVFFAGYGDGNYIAFNFTTAATDENGYADSVTWDDLDLTREIGVIQNATAGFGDFEVDLEAIGWRPSRSSVLANAVNSADVAEALGMGVIIPTSDMFFGARANSQGESGVETAGSLTIQIPPAPSNYFPSPQLPPLSFIQMPPAASGPQTQFLVNGSSMNGTTTVVNGAIRLIWDSYQVNITPTLTPGSLSGISSDGVLEYVVGDGTSTTVSGFGLMPLSTVQIYILSTPILLGTFSTDAEGKFSGSMVLPSTMASGMHYLQVNGYSKQRTTVSGSVAVRVQRVVESTASSKPITFKVNSSRLSTKNKNLIKQLVQEIDSASGFVQKSKIVINGSASPEGTARLNKRLAQARANAVMAYLKQLGVSSDIIEITQDDKRSRSAQIQVIYKNKA